MARDRNGVDKSSKHFLMGPKGILHMDPAHEECNIDEIPRHRRQRFLTEDEAKMAGMRRRCEHCWPRSFMRQPRIARPTARTPARPDRE